MDDAKTTALRQQGTLNRRPGRVNDELFRGNEFFDRRDVVQVVIAVLKVPEFSRFEMSVSSAGSSSPVEHKTVFFGLSWGFFGPSGGDTHFQTGRFEVLSDRPIRRTFRSAGLRTFLPPRYLVWVA